jgi:hypothetical protein
VQDIWDHSGNQRKKKGNAFPGAPDAYRETRYRRNYLCGSFEVLYTLIQDDDEAEDNSTFSRDDSTVVRSPPSL